ncbi:hypothetical protein [Mangrovimonas aestuarii]|uniref:hypothetical protein n=1 Tax=Mangrovimonas aestuarii TaxID=3018443 RepID=UPI0023795FFF|nr:hypothetical protein [Mangrovimonas aestuarii]
MKKNLFKASMVSAIFAFSLAFTGCSKEDTLSEQNQNQEQNMVEVVLAAQMDQITTSIEDLIIETYQNQESETSRQNTENQVMNSDCMSISAVIQAGFKQVTIDFGNEGCSINGYVYKGKIIMTYDPDLEAMEDSINYTLEDFYFDGINIDGSSNILRQLSNENGNPQFTHTVDLTVSWPNGMQATRDGQVVREWVEGFASGSFQDNVFEVTGYWDANFVNGNSHTYEVLTPLRREATCWYFVSGTLDVERPNFGGVLDYGSGECDNQAVFTLNSGVDVNVTL